MKHAMLFFLLFVTAFPLWAEVGILSVVSEDVHTKKEDFWHTFEYYAIPANGKATKCQATRIGKKWFATAAHCVAEACRNDCTLRVDLLEQPFSVFASVKHTSKKPLVFIHPRYTPAEPVVHDFALLNIDLERADAHYYRRAKTPQEQNEFVSRSVFNNFLKQNPVARRELDRALRPQPPALLVFDGDDAQIDRELSVISIFGGKRQILHNPYPTDYVRKLGFAYTRNFGVWEGMSGSGVMTNTGELAGIISAYLGIRIGDGKEQEYFMFAVFNPDLTQFMESVMGSDYYKLDRRRASDGYTKQTKASHQDILMALQTISSSKK